MASNRPAAFNTLRMGGELYPSSHSDDWTLANHGAEVIREKVQDGVTGEQREIQYTQCKIVGNGSFGVVFQTKLSPSGEDAAIKRVLQDKRFKVSTGGANFEYQVDIQADSRRIVNYRLCASCATPMSSSSRHSIIPTANA